VWVGPTEPVQPDELEDLLGEEEGAYEDGLWGEEGEVGVVDVFHVWGGEEAVDLGREVDDEAQGG